MSAPETILVVDDEPQIFEMLEDYLTSHGCAVLTADSGQAMKTMFESQRPDLVLLDINMPGEDGLTLARHLREHLDIGIIMVTGAGEVIDRIVGLEVGADDYGAKPFDPRELLARVKSVLRRTGAKPAAENTEQEPPQSIRFGKCTLDLEAHRLLGPDQEEIPITSMEFELLRALGEHPNRVLSRDQILNLTQNRDWDPFDRSIDIRITRIRRKIETEPSKPRIIRTVHGAGYMYVPGAD